MTYNGIRRRLPSQNDPVAAGIRESLERTGALALNFIGSPGSGKTTLLEQTLQRLSIHDEVAVLAADGHTDIDARRLKRYGHPVRQVATGALCHLDASMVERQLAGWPERLELLLIENVGNLICPASYDLGEDAKIVVWSVTEGEDKPLKYPAVFRQAELMILNKIDLLPYVAFSPVAARENARRIHPDIEIIQMSCTRGDGLEQWIHWLAGRAVRKQMSVHRFADRAGI